MATVEFEGPSGESLTLKLFTEHTDTQVASVSATERTNKKGWYTATVSGQSGTKDVSVQDATGFAHVTGKIDIRDDSGTYEPYSSRERILPEPAGPPTAGDATWEELLAWWMVLSLNKITVDDSETTVRNAADDADLATFANTDTGALFTSGAAS